MSVCPARPLERVEPGTHDPRVVAELRVDDSQPHPADPGRLLQDALGDTTPQLGTIEEDATSQHDDRGIEGRRQISDGDREQA